MAAWEVYPELTETLIVLSEGPNVLIIDSLHMERLELWAVIMYSKSLGCSRVNDARCQLFTHGTRMLDHIPPTQAALFQHARWRCWRQPLCGGNLKHHSSMYQTISQWGWMQEKTTKNWVPFWTALSDASSACAILHHCGCTKACRGNCKCCKAGLRCTILCNCERGCINNDVF